MAPYYYGGYPYYSPYYPPYYPPAVAPAPSVYMEQPAQPQVAPTQPQGSWYYCAASRAYYPYVRDCPSGWQRVSPQPPGG
jgi:hypothetical protein